MTLDRRQLLKALGLGALVGPRAGALAAPQDTPRRVVFFVQPHGHVPKGWTMPVPGPTDDVGRLSLPDLPAERWSEVLRPLTPFASKLSVIEGLSHASVLADIAQVNRTGGDANNHQIAVAGLLTGARAAQNPGQRCTGGARSIDQELALRLAAPGRFGSRVYGAGYVPNQTVSPFSFLGPAQATPVVGDPKVAFDDLIGATSQAPGGTPSRAERLRGERASVLDLVGQEFEALAPRLGADDRRKLEHHRALVRDLERSLASGVAPACEAAFDASGTRVTQFMRVIALALRCDLTRVVTYVAPVPQGDEFGYPADANVHGMYAHGSIEGATACGQLYTPLNERAMIDLGTWYARHLATLLGELDAVPEGDGTVLDHTAVVWLTELGTPTHEHHDAFALVAGSLGGTLQTGQYLRYPRTASSPLPGFPLTGPAHNRLLVTLLQALGFRDRTFGLPGAIAADGTSVSFAGPLPELQRRS
ncbi:MAG: DUF1552 domain-containing protein [Myxococcaceae bacterium]|nr:DUF1552 domain-containing protein [Myxococcaceae bacterium]